MGIASSTGEPPAGQGFFWLNNPRTQGGIMLAIGSPYFFDFFTLEQMAKNACGGKVSRSAYSISGYVLPSFYSGVNLMYFSKVYLSGWADFSKFQVFDENGEFLMSSTAAVASAEVGYVFHPDSGVFLLGGAALDLSKASMFSTYNAGLLVSFGYSSDSDFYFMSKFLYKLSRTYDAIFLLGLKLFDGFDLNIAASRASISPFSLEAGVSGEFSGVVFRVMFPILSVVSSTPDYRYQMSVFEGGLAVERGLYIVGGYSFSGPVEVFYIRLLGR